METSEEEDGEDILQHNVFSACDSVPQCLQDSWWAIMATDGELWNRNRNLNGLT